MNKKSIKFRAWDKEERIMIPADAFYFSEEFEPFVDSVERAQESFEIMQFTGLKDENGIEVYEGDILKLSEEYWYGYAELIQKVIWQPSWASFDLVPGTNGEYSSIVEIQQYGSFEVIGNIYEHPELLEKK